MQNQNLLIEKEKEVEILKQKMNEMTDNMRTLIELTKKTTDDTELAKVKHQ